MSEVCYKGKSMVRIEVLHENLANSPRSWAGHTPILGPQFIVGKLNVGDRLYADRPGLHFLISTLCVVSPLQHGQGLWRVSDQQNVAKVMGCHTYDYITQDRTTHLTSRLSIDHLPCWLWGSEPPYREVHLARNWGWHPADSSPGAVALNPMSSRNWILSTSMCAWKWILLLHSSCRWDRSPGYTWMRACETLKHWGPRLLTRRHCEIIM